MLPNLKSRAGITLVEVLVSAALLGVAAYSVSHQISLGFRSSRNLVGLKAIAQVDGAIPRAIFRLVATHFRNAANCTAAGLRAAMTQNLGNGVSVMMPNGPLVNVPEEHLAAATRCGGAFNAVIANDQSFRFCLLIQPTAGQIPPRDSVVGMAPFFGEFVFQATNLANGAPVGCRPHSAPPPPVVSLANKGASMTYVLYWGEQGNAHRYSGSVSEANL